MTFPAVVIGGGFVLGSWFYVLFIINAVLKGLSRQLVLFGAGSLQENIEADFFTKLVKINFKYIDQYYLQTQDQADKSFYLSAAVSVVSLAIIVCGIVMMFLDKTNPAYVTAAAGVLGQFISAVFFYLYNRTIVAMASYHQKLVLTQNVGLALKIAEGLPDAERVKSQMELITRLSENVNAYLAQRGEATTHQ